MTLTLTAYSPDGFTIVGGIETQAYAAEGTTRGKLQGSSASVADAATRMVTVGGVSRPVLAGGLHVPVSADLPVAGDRGVGWEYEVTAIDSHDDPTLLGRRFLVVGVPAKSFATARRLDVVEV